MLIFYWGQNTIQFKYSLQDSFSLSDEKDVHLMGKYCPVRLLKVNTFLSHSAYSLRGDGLNCMA
jgi:hypothetical protein